jgi:hypothetical protein
MNLSTTLKNRFVRFAASLVVGLAAPLAMATDAAKHDFHGGQIEFTVDVSEDFTKFVPAPPIENTIPQRGSFFITEGKIYPAGTINGDGTTFDPTDPKGPKAAGRWFCRGTHLVAGNEIPATKEPWVYTSQLYLLPDDGASIDTSGIEQTAPIVRMVTGGTGRFKRIAGVQKQEFLGFNKLGGVNLRVTFVLKKVD